MTKPMKKKTKLYVYVDRIIRKFISMGIDNWIKGAEAKTKEENLVNFKAKRACKFCNIGVAKLIAGPRVANILNDEWQNTLGVGMVLFNDRYSTTYGSNLENWVKLRAALKKENK